MPSKHPPLTYQSSISDIPRVLPSYVERLKKIGIVSVRDLLMHFPYRYEDFSSIKPIHDLRPGESATIQGTLRDIRNLRTFRRRLLMTQATVEDETGSVRLVWFNQPYLIKNLLPGIKISAAGKISLDRSGIIMYSPAFELSQKDGEGAHTGRLVPVYPTTQGLSVKWIRQKIHTLLPLSRTASDSIPKEVLEEYKLPSLANALQLIHFPATTKDYEAARKRFAFEQMLLIQLRLLQNRSSVMQEKAKPIPTHQDQIDKFIKSLPFRLTHDQQKSIEEILSDMRRGAPMNRLVDGDVGSGKTILAAVAAYDAALNRRQTALMAPTEILAKQHFYSLANLFKSLHIQAGLLTSSQRLWVTTDQEAVAELKPKEMLRKISEGEIDIVIGTHALIQESVVFQDLVLAIIDEQHRFGVLQRKALREKSGIHHVPHLLSLSATPIPRTLAIALYGDLDISLLKEMPPGRKPIQTNIIPASRAAWAYEQMRQRLNLGEQAFVICPRIARTENEEEFTDPDIVLSALQQKRMLLAQEVKSVTEEHERLSRQIFPEFSCAMLHGKMKSEEKTRIMEDFRSGRTRILVATSVIEVGVDVPNATLMLIENAERFGLAQLHQFRGRIGRSDKQSYCFAIAHSQDADALARMNALLSAKDGFELAEYDLRLRGPGQFVDGERQSGMPDFAMASLGNVRMVQAAKTAAQKILSADPNLSSHETLRKELAKNYFEVHLE